MSTWSFVLDHGGDITPFVDVNSIERTVRLHTELKSNLNKLSFRIKYDATLFGTLLSYDPVEIQVDKDSLPYFTGYLSPNYKAQIRDGQRYIDIIAEDATLQLLGTIIADPWAKAGYAVCTPSATGTSLVHAIATEAGITLAAGAPTISATIPYVVVLPEDKKSWGTLLGDILFEFGYCYNYDADGSLALYQTVNAGTVVTTGTLTTAAGTANIRGELLVEKTPEKYDDIRVNYDLVELKTGIVVFQDADEITMAAAGDAGGADYYPLTSKVGEVFSAWKSPDGYTIWVVTSPVLSATLESGIVLDSAFANYYRKASFAYQNTAAATKKITGLKITGNAYVISSKNTVRSSAAGGKLIYEHKAQYLYSDASAQTLAELLGQYYKYSDIKYTVRSATELTLGQYVTVSDAIYAGISTKCRVVGITQKEAPTVIYEYTLEGVADFVAITTAVEGGHDGTPTSGDFGASDYYLNTPPSANITDLVISSAANPNGAVDVTFEFNYTQGAVAADGFLIFTKQSILTPGTIDINTDLAHFVPVGADGAYSKTLTLPTRQAGAGTIPIRYRFGVVSFASRRAGTVVHAAGPVEDASWIDVTFAAEMTDMPLRSYNGQGVNRRAIQIDNEALDWIDCPDTSPASPEVLRARIGRLGVGGSILMDGELFANITTPWSSAGVISAYQCHESDMITMPDGTLASVYRVASSNDIVSRFFDGASWGAEVVVSSGVSQGNAVLYVSNSGDLHCIHSYGSLGSIVDRIWSGSSWGAYSTVITDVSYGSLAVIASGDGEVRISYQDRTTYYVTEITSPDGATWGAPVSLTNYIASPNDYLYSGDFGLRLCYRKASNGYLFQVVHNGSSWEAEAEVISVDIGFTKYIELISGELFLYYRKTSDTKIYSSQYVSGAFGAGVLVVDTASNYLSTAQDVSGIIHILFSPTTGGYLNERTLQRYARIGGGFIAKGATDYTLFDGAKITVSGTSLTGYIGPQGPKGDTGDTGPQGATGDAATIAVGTVTPGEDPEDASVTNVGTSGAAVFDFVLPKGDQGVQGEKGDTGEAGTITADTIDGNFLVTGNLTVTGKMTVPIGFTYFQLPGKALPSDMFLGTWSNISSSFAGAFFRAEGGAASAFDAGQQSSQNIIHSHEASSGTQSASHTHTTNSTSKTLTGEFSPINSYGAARRTGGFFSGVFSQGADQSWQFGASQQAAGANLKIDATHTHGTGVQSASHSHTVAVNADGGTEARPVNYTIRIWERTA
ncbi:MAG: hypothetical protein AB7T74_02290 [Clostridia bacterium]